ncbi:MAG TPA: biotin-independent malonate decarboxylase subunit beta [Ktedonobacteraceae bacterium]|jgi:malonate decarboxylase beta subunit|nr:biotin-independent malonate decarboxylase subunit beta [Ktedonobacteraceae bacterium]
MIPSEPIHSPLKPRHSFLELHARERAQALLDAGTFRELLGPFDRLESPWLEPQGIVPESDDGVIIARGFIAGWDAVVVAIEGAFLGGSIGEVSGAKIAGALELALRDCEQGHPVYPVLSLESGGVRLQEANLGLNAIAEISSAIVSLRRYVPVIGVITGMVGCFGGMSIAAGLCSYLIATRAARLGLNGPEVIEQEAGIEEFDARDRQLIWSVDGGEQRYACGLVDFLVEDDTPAIVATIQECFRRGLPATHRSTQVDSYRALFADIDLSEQLDSATARTIFEKRGTR